MARQTRVKVKRERYRHLGLSASHARSRFEVSLTVDYIKRLIGFPEGQPNWHVANGQSDSLIEYAPKGSENLFYFNCICCGRVQKLCELIFSSTLISYEELNKIILFLCILLHIEKYLLV